MGILIPADLIVKLNKIPDSVINKKILYIFAGLEGNCDVFQDLAESLAKSSIQVYGLQFTEKVPLESINSISRFYLNEIKKISNNQEFFLAAYSYGGSIAIELSRILEQEENKSNLVKKLFLFDTSQSFFKIGAHLNFKIFNRDIVKDSFLNHKHVYTAVLSIYLTNLFGLNKLKFNLYESIKETSTCLENAIDRAFEFFDKNNLVKFENESNLNENKRFLKLLVLKSDPNLMYEYQSKIKLHTHVCLFKPKSFLYSKTLAGYIEMKNSIKFNEHDYCLNEIVENLKIIQFSEGSHWSFINDNLNDICSTIVNETNIYSKL